MKFLSSLFKTIPQRSYDEIIHEARLEDAELLAVCELNLMGQRTGPRETNCIIALKDKQLIIAPLSQGSPSLNLSTSSLSLVRPGSDELRFKTKVSAAVTAEYFKVDRPSYGVANQTLTYWSNEVALQFFEKLLANGATEIDRRQL